MSDSFTCPGCGSTGSTTRRQVEQDGRCGHCGLSADAIYEIEAVRIRRGDERLKADLEAAIKRAGAAESERDKLSDRLRRLTEAFEDVMKDER
jgi:transcription elongation factor Elf1